MKLSIRNFLTKLLKSENLVLQIYTVLNSRLNVFGRLKIRAGKRVYDGIMEIYRVYIPPFPPFPACASWNLLPWACCATCVDFYKYSAVGVTEFVESWEKVCEMFLRSTLFACTQVYLSLSIITLLAYILLWDELPNLLILTQELN